MTLAALISAYHESDEAGGPLRATLPLAGRSLVERQARLAASAGADPVVVLVERMPPALAAAIDRMRGEGIAVAVARSVAEAADLVHPNDRLLLMADGVLAGESHVARIAAAPGAAILTIADRAGDDRFERIDAESRWGGLAMVDGELLRRTAAMLGDWDLQSTVLRRAVQGGARQFAVQGDVAGDRIVIAERIADLAEAELHIVEAASAASGGWASVYLLAPAERAATRALMPTAFGPQSLCVLAATLTTLACLFFTRHWLWAGALLMLLATPLEGIAARLAALRLQPGGGTASWWRYVMPALGAFALGALGWGLADTRGWGCIVLAAAAAAFLLALHGEVGAPARRPLFLAERKGMTWLMLPFAAAGQWVAGLGALALYAAGSFFWAQRAAHEMHEAAPGPAA